MYIFNVKWVQPINNKDKELGIQTYYIPEYISFKLLGKIICKREDFLEGIISKILEKKMTDLLGT